ncbi:hypothetical protein [Nitrosomonas sp. Nm166]|uniref:hypothetical protein n=1 Tax=Nitrosomonas sp. Nm166 TaxID=1881054 RepID=UPI000B833A06|nr:hypothetical protein [Nitrosomonas sp. Nm166]
MHDNYVLNQVIEVFAMSFLEFDVTPPCYKGNFLNQIDQLGDVPNIKCYRALSACLGGQLARCWPGAGKDNCD